MSNGERQIRGAEQEVTEAVSGFVVFVVLAGLTLLGFAVGAWWAIAHWWPA